MMKKYLAMIVAAGLATLPLLLGGCVQMPTEKQGVSDMRPQSSFKAEAKQTQAARVMIDGLDMGIVSDYLEGVAALRILPGTHQLRVVTGGVVLLDEKIYLGDGVARAFIVK